MFQIEIKGLSPNINYNLVVLAGNIHVTSAERIVSQITSKLIAIGWLLLVLVAWTSKRRLKLTPSVNLIAAIIVLRSEII